MRLKRSNANRKLLEKTAKDTNQSYHTVEDVTDFYKKTVAQLVMMDKPVTIHIDYIGRLEFNEKHYKKYLEVNGKTEAIKV